MDSSIDPITSTVATQAPTTAPTLIATPRVLQTPQTYRSRNVHIYNDDGIYLGGFFQNPNPLVSNANFYDMCREFLRFNPPWTIFHLNGDGSTGLRLPRTGSDLTAGSYVVLDPQGKRVNVTVTDELPVRRVLTCRPSTSKLSRLEKHFRDSVRSRDNVCAITGIGGFAFDQFAILDAVHIFPVAQRDIWEQNNYGMAWITDTSTDSRIGDSRLYSAQNGLFLKSDVHCLFGMFRIAVNPDDGYKVVSFCEDVLQIGGKTLSRSATQAQSINDRVSDEVLRWHFRQAILTNMKGAGQKSWEHDYGGEDDIGQIMEDPDAAERMEVELFTRLGSCLEYDRAPDSTTAVE